MLQMFVTILTAGCYRPAGPVQLKQPFILDWSDVSAKDRMDSWIMNAGPVQMYKTCMFVCTSLQI